MQYRVTQLEKVREEDNRVKKDEHDREKREYEAAIQSVREEGRASIEESWKAIHLVENELHAHEKQSYEERLRISEKFTQVLLAQNTMVGDLKNVMSGIGRLEVDVKALALDFKNK